MPRGVHTSQRPSGCKQREKKRKQDEEQQAIAGSMLKYLRKNAEEPASEDEFTPECSEDFVDTKNVEESVSAPYQPVEQTEDSRSVATETEEESGSTSYQPTEQAGVPNQSHEDMLSDGNVEEDISDIGCWNIPVTRDQRLDIVKTGSKAIQNENGPFQSAVRSGQHLKGEERSLSKDWFFKTLPNGEKILRSWMVYSLKTNKLYCFCCRLFCKSISPTESRLVVGFDKWWKLNPKISDHEKSEAHHQNFEKWKLLQNSIGNNTTIDNKLIEAAEVEKKKWRNLLHRLLDITLFLSKQNLAFRGHREDEDSLNKGNFLELVELMGKYDPVLNEHLVRLNNSSGKRAPSSYLSPAIQNEFIDLLGNAVKDVILGEIKRAKYFGVMYDSTPDVSRVDQMSQIIRYVHIEGKQVQIKEAFLGFFAIKGKKAVDMSQEILTNLESDGLDFDDCRSQGYDNCNVMAGVRGGVQKHLRDRNKKAIFNGCIDHSLNLCGQHAFSINSASVTFFGTLENVYSFFAGSTHRWDILKKHTNASLNRTSTTRWSANFHAVKSVCQNLDGILAAVDELSSPGENLETRGAALCVGNSIKDFTFLCFLFFWYQSLKEIDDAQTYLQKKGLTLDRVVTKLQALDNHFDSERQNLVKYAIDTATQKAEELDIPTQKRMKRKKLLPGEKDTQVTLTTSEENQRCMLECVDSFLIELRTRSKGFLEVLELFKILQPQVLLSGDENELKESAKQMTALYDDISADDLVHEIIRFRRLLNAAHQDFIQVHNWSPLEMLQFIVSWDYLESVPTLALSLRLFLTVCVSVATCERSFSKLKLIKSYLRSTMSQARLSSLAILSIENELAKKLDFDDLISNFAAAKARKQQF